MITGEQIESCFTSVLDWSTRRIALDVAQSVAYHHDKAPFQVICRNLSSPASNLVRTSGLDVVLRATKVWLWLAPMLHLSQAGMG
ncbi:unnamed protein product [Calypogeia fissa]